MHIEELNGEESVGELDNRCVDVTVPEDRTVAVWDAKRLIVGAGARFLFYPTLLYNVVRNKIQSEFRWWDQVDQFLLLGAVPFPTDVLRLKELGVGGVITLNEPYETLVPTSLYHLHEIEHLVIPTRDYLFAPSMADLSQAVDFIHKNASCSRTTYVHCKAGRGRSTTVVLCYLVHYKQMTPEVAYQYVKSIRPRVLLASSQRRAVQNYYNLKVKKQFMMTNPRQDLMMRRILNFSKAAEFLAFDDGSVVIVTSSDLDGYSSTENNNNNKLTSGRTHLTAIYKVRMVGEAALARISCMWLRCHDQQKIAGTKGGFTIEAAADQMSHVTVDIHVY